MRLFRSSCSSTTVDDEAGQAERERETATRLRRCSKLSPRAAKAFVVNGILGAPGSGLGATDSSSLGASSSALSVMYWILLKPRCDPESVLNEFFQGRFERNSRDASATGNNIAN